MNRYEFTDDMGFSWKRVSKRKARAAYCNGLGVMLAPYNMRLFTGWGESVYITHEDLTCTRDEGFTRWVNEFEYYTPRKLGRYTAFYLPLRYIDRFTGEPCPEWRDGAALSYNTDVLAAYGRG